MSAQITYNEDAPGPVLTLDLLGVPYDVFLVDEILAGGDDCNGLVSYREQAIYVTTAAAPEYRAVILLHEVMHVLDHALDLELDESDLIKLGFALYSTLKYNPQLMEALDG